MRRIKCSALTINSMVKTEFDIFGVFHQIWASVNSVGFALILSVINELHLGQEETVKFTTACATTCNAVKL